MAKAARRQQKEKIHLGDAKLDVLPLRREFPFRGRGDLVFDKGVGLRRPGEKLPAVHPRAEACRPRHIRRGRHDPLRQFAAAFGETVQNAPEGHLGGRFLRRPGVNRGHGEARVGIAARPGGEERRFGDEPLQRRRVFNPGERLPFLAFRNTHMGLPFGHLFRCHQAAVVVLVARDRRAPALDRIGEETNGAVVVYAREDLRHRLDAVAAEIFHEVGEFFVTPPLDQRGDVALIAKVVHQSLPPDRAAHIGQRGILLVRAGVDPFAQAPAARFGEGGALQGAVFHLHHIPAEGAEDVLDALKEPLAHDPVQRLAVIVYDPPAIAQVVLPAFLKAFIYVALVQLRIADQRHHAAERPVAAP